MAPLATVGNARRVGALRRRAFGLRPVPSSPSRPFGINPSRLRACGAALALKIAPRRNGRACGTTPRLAAAGCTKACRPRRWRFVACTSRRTVHRHATRPCNGASTPRFKQEAACYVRDAFTLSSGVVFARARAQAGEAVTREAESAMFLSERVGPRRPVCL